MSETDISKKVEVFKREHPRLPIKEMSISSSKKLYVIDENCKFLASTNLIHIETNKHHSEKTDKIIKKMREDINFRNFICVNIQDLFNRLSYRYHKYTEPLEGYSEEYEYFKDIFIPKQSLSRVKLIGFIKSGVELEDPNKTAYFNEITSHYKKALSFFIKRDEMVDFDKHIKTPFKQLITILEIPFCCY